MLLHLALKRAARLFPNNIATIFNSQRQTYGELNARTRAFARVLQSLGIQRGDTERSGVVDGKTLSRRSRDEQRGSQNSQTTKK